MTASTRHDLPIRMLVPTRGRVRVTARDHVRADVSPFVAPLEPFASHACRLLGEDLVRKDRDGRLVVPVGLVAAVERELTGAKYQVTVEHRGSASVVTADPAVLAAANGDDRRFLTAAANTSGLVELDHGHQLLTRVAQLLDLFPAARVLVLVSDRVKLGGYVAALEEHLDAPVGRITRTRRIESPRCLVATYETVSLYRPAGPVVLAVPEAGRDPAGACRAVACATGVGRVFAFAHDLRHFAADEVLMTAAVAGEVIRSAPVTSAPARVFVLPAPAITVPTTDSPLAHKRAAYWHNAVRNRLVADVARAVLANDMTALTALGFPISNGILPHTTSLPRVLVLVESPEHGRELMTLLPGWPLLTTATADTVASGLAPGIIATVPYVASHAVPPDVVVRATGGYGPLTVTGFPWPATFDQATPAVIDFDDGTYHLGRRHTNQRVTEYRHAGWAVEVRQ